MNKTQLRVSVTPLWPLPVYTHHAPLITCISAERSVMSPAIGGIKQPYLDRSYLPSIALIAGAALRITCLYSWSNLGASKTKGADRSTTTAGGKREGFHPAVGRGIFTQLLRTEYQVAAGKSFVVS